MKVTTKIVYMTDDNVEHASQEDAALYVILHVLTDAICKIFPNDLKFLDTDDVEFLLLNHRVDIMACYNQLDKIVERKKKVIDPF